MNDRDFAAAHDRYLDSPDLDEDTEQDEDSAYDIDRQRRLDEEELK